MTLWKTICCCCVVCTHKNRRSTPHRLAELFSVCSFSIHWKLMNRMLRHYRSTEMTNSLVDWLADCCFSFENSLFSSSSFVRLVLLWLCDIMPWPVTSCTNKSGNSPDDKISFSQQLGRCAHFFNRILLLQSRHDIFPSISLTLLLSVVH